jgi:hypothetical protein
MPSCDRRQKLKVSIDLQPLFHVGGLPPFAFVDGIRRSRTPGRCRLGQCADPYEQREQAQDCKRSHNTVPAAHRFAAQEKVPAFRHFPMLQELVEAAAKLAVPRGKGQWD